MNAQLITKLNQIFTPFLLNESTDEESKVRFIQELSELNLLAESKLHMDANDKAAALRAVCALLIAEFNQTETFKIYKEASRVRQASRIKMQEENAGLAQELAKQYLLDLSTNSTNERLRNTASQLINIS